MVTAFRPSLVGSDGSAEGTPPHQAHAKGSGSSAQTAASVSAGGPDQASYGDRVGSVGTCKEAHSPPETGRNRARESRTVP